MTARAATALLMLHLLRAQRLDAIKRAARKHEHRPPFRRMMCPACNPEMP